MKEKYTFAFYNVENLFDIIDDPNTQDDEYTPFGKKKWDLKKYQNKIGKLAQVILEIGKDQTGTSPSLVGLCEVENSHVLNDLIHHVNLYELGYEIVHFESKDERGVDTALLYKKSDFFITHKEPIRFELENPDGTEDFTRDTLFVQGLFKGQAISVFVSHLPSKRLDDQNKPKRLEIAGIIKQKYQELLSGSQDKYVLLMGDYNDDPFSETLAGFGAQEDPFSLPFDTLFNPMISLAKQGKGSLVHKGEFFLFDQMLLSKAFLGPNASIKHLETSVFDALLVKEWKGVFEGNPFRTYVGNKYLGGYSDHFPIYSIFEK
ncbi:MAG: endonuclease [Flavobacteriaceae bacterium]|nr:MAG: endonuclease [Flavobacteriaceae bacterium]